ncbi:hypothetical protein KIPB_002715 [Kipferlia bialata]|uniref:AAA+ ATPase domain-containing protein n=1 Tax=Kipferlia bialata TaxID=797122 RepID=A0A9K3CSP3_9EUKA|nr:hypothetical protein KIPB_002715 [Kipferlia bialata]|eukprot:g2715.t1
MASSLTGWVRDSAGDAALGSGVNATLGLFSLYAVTAMEDPTGFKQAVASALGLASRDVGGVASQIKGFRTTTMWTEFDSRQRSTWPPVFPPTDRVQSRSSSDVVFCLADRHLSTCISELSMCLKVLLRQRRLDSGESPSQDGPFSSLSGTGLCTAIACVSHTLCKACLYLVHPAGEGRDPVDLLGDVSPSASEHGRALGDREVPPSPFGDAVALALLGAAFACRHSGRPGKGIFLATPTLRLVSATLLESVLSAAPFVPAPVMSDNATDTPHHPSQDIARDVCGVLGANWTRYYADQTGIETRTVKKERDGVLYEFLLRQLVEPAVRASAKPSPLPESPSGTSLVAPVSHRVLVATVRALLVSLGQADAADGSLSKAVAGASHPLSKVLRTQAVAYGHTGEGGVLSTELLVLADSMAQAEGQGERDRGQGADSTIVASSSTILSPTLLRQHYASRLPLLSISGPSSPALYCRVMGELASVLFATDTLSDALSGWTSGGEEQRERERERGMELDSDVGSTAMRSTEKWHRITDRIGDTFCVERLYQEGEGERGRGRGHPRERERDGYVVIVSTDSDGLVSGIGLATSKWERERHADSFDLSVSLSPAAPHDVECERMIRKIESRREDGGGSGNAYYVGIMPPFFHNHVRTLLLTRGFASSPPPLPAWLYSPEVTPDPSPLSLSLSPLMPGTGVGPLSEGLVAIEAGVERGGRGARSSQVSLSTGPAEGGTHRMATLSIKGGPTLGVTVPPPEPSAPALTGAQVASIVRALHYPVSVIVGPPGCGKTFTAATLSALYLRAQARPGGPGLRDLLREPLRHSNRGPLVLCAHSNRAVDHMLESVMGLSGVSALRVGGGWRQTRESGIHPQSEEAWVGAVLDDLEPYTGHLSVNRSHPFDDLSPFRTAKPLPSCSPEDAHMARATLNLLGKGRGAFRKHVADRVSLMAGTVSSLSVCGLLNSRCPPSLMIIEEAARIPELELVPLLSACAKHTLLLGDPLQLPPLIRDASLACRARASFSLLHRLVASRAPVTVLDTQCRAVPELADTWRDTYTPLLVSLGQVPARIRDGGRVGEMERARGKMERRGSRVLPPVSCIRIRQGRNGCREENEQEARECVALVETILTSKDGWISSVTVLSPYRKQARLVSRMLSSAGVDTKEVRAATIDEYQGLEADAIILSLCSPTPTAFSCESARVVVALSRARKALVVVGNVSGWESRESWAMLRGIRELSRAERSGMVEPNRVVQKPTAPPRPTSSSVSSGAPKAQPRAPPRPPARDSRETRGGDARPRVPETSSVAPKAPPRPAKTSLSPPGSAPVGTEADGMQSLIAKMGGLGMSSQSAKTTTNATIADILKR